MEKSVGAEDEEYRSLTQISRVSASGIFVNREFTSKLAMKQPVLSGEDISFANEKESLIVNSLDVMGASCGTKNLARA
ncbi:MAG: hypothetical protein GY696_27945 [Gammaproteobacteria bacterium]|nr:hypothetical protein [Gammaproteobacteria bacterium]